MHYQAIGTATLTPGELLERQFNFFVEECDDDIYKKYFGDWIEELQDEGSIILTQPNEWADWCFKCLEVNEGLAHWLGTYVAELFSDYKDGWNS